MAKHINDLEEENRKLARKVKDLHQCLFNKPQEIIEIIKSDSILLSYLDRVYQKDILNYNKLEKRLQDLVCKDTRMKRSHSFDYLPQRNSNFDNDIEIKIEDQKFIFQNVYQDIIQEDEREHVSNHLSSDEGRQFHLDKQLRLDYRRSSNHPIPKNENSFIGTNANDSFMREYQDHEYYSSKYSEKGHKYLGRTPAANDYDQNLSKAHTRFSDISRQNTNSKHHNRHVSEELILEDNHDLPKIEFEKNDNDIFDKEIVNILTSLRYIVTRLDPESMEAEKSISQLNLSPKNQDIFITVCKEIDLHYQEKMKKKMLTVQVNERNIQNNNFEIEEKLHSFHQISSGKDLEV